MKRRLNIIVSTSHRDWVLGILANVLAEGITHAIPEIIELPQSRRDTRKLKGSIYFPKADYNLFLHQDLAVTAFSRGWLNQQSQNLLYFTHLTREPKFYKILEPYLNLVLHNNSETFAKFVEIGFSPKDMIITPNPVDTTFANQIPSSKHLDVVFVSSYGWRKRPDLLLEVVKSLHKVKFTLIGRGWVGSPEYKELITLKNFAYTEFEFETYPTLLAQHKVFCTLSDLEGGPVPLLESLVTGLSVVATDTGTASDLIPPPCRKFILPINPTVEMICQSISKALKVDNPGFESKKIHFYDGFVHFINSKLGEFDDA
jgi:glycosyltransferase involved in cell wall biosynthesis